LLLPTCALAVGCGVHERIHHARQHCSFGVKAYSAPCATRSDSRPVHLHPTACAMQFTLADRQLISCEASAPLVVAAVQWRQVAGSNAIRCSATRHLLSSSGSSTRHCGHLEGSLCCSRALVRSDAR
jgi:hypothetical protein